MCTTNVACSPSQRVASADKAIAIELENVEPYVKGDVSDKGDNA